MNAYLRPDKEGAADLARSMTFKQWNQRTNRLANGLLRLGLKKGDRLAVIAYNRVEWMEIYAAAAKSGIIAVPIMFRLAPPEYEYIIKNSGAKAFIVAEHFIDGAESIRDKCKRVVHWIYLGSGRTPRGYVGYEALIRKTSPAEPDVTVTHDDVWTIMYTSGTTGRPKGVVRTHESFIAQYLLNIAALEYRRDDRSLLVMPMCHVNSIFNSFVFTYIGAACVVYDRISFDPEHLLKTLSRKRITYTSLVPTHYIMMLALPDKVRRKYDTSSVRKLMCSSAPARKDTKEDILRVLFPKSQLYEAYGSTESGLATLLYPDEQFDKLGSIGREIPGTDKIKLLGEDGQEVPDGQVGELYSRTPETFTEYWKMPAETEAAFVGEWFSAGDMARRDSDGYYYLVDRKQNMIITGGENVYPSEVENVVGAHRAVKDVAVIGVPDDKWGEMVTAVVILNQGFEPSSELGQEIMDFCRGKIAGFKRPKRVDFFRDENMPRVGPGKIDHRRLRGLFNISREG
jgi:acyl-CoA synthetase (AMP-forming)/AMP-acid ligase II